MRGSLFPILSVFSLALAAEKGETRCKPCSYPCLEDCNDNVKMEAAKMAVQTICSAFETDSLATFNTMVGSKSSIQYLVQSGFSCVDSGIMPFLQGVVPLINAVGCHDTTVVSASVDELGRVVIITDDNFTIGGLSTPFRSTYVFDVCTDDCKFTINTASIKQKSCL